LCPNGFFTIGVVLHHDRLVLEEVDTRRGQRTRRQLEPVRSDRASRFATHLTGVVNRKAALLDDDPFGFAVAAVPVSPGEHLTVAIERVLH
jgi:hypothetical protein